MAQSDSLFLVHSDNPSDITARSDFAEFAGPLLQVDLDAVLGADRTAVIRYVDAWRDARSCLLSELATWNPDVHLPPLTVEFLDQEAMIAPFGPWQRVGADRRAGLALALLARLRNILADSCTRAQVPANVRLLPPDLAMTETALQDVGDTPVTQVYRLVHSALSGHRTMARQIVDAFALSAAELGELFGVTRQAATQWLATEIPRDRRAKAATVLAIADLLGHYLKVDRVAGVVRKPAQAYGGRTMIQMIKESEHERLLDLVRESFDFDKTA